MSQLVPLRIDSPQHLQRQGLRLFLLRRVALTISQKQGGNDWNEDSQEGEYGDCGN